MPCPDQTYKEAQGCNPCTNIEPACSTCETSTKCLTCSDNLRVNAQGKCECLPPFHMLDSGCIECPPDFIFDEVQKTCINPSLIPINPSPSNSTETSNNSTAIIQCRAGYILVNNKCECNKFSVEYNETCIPCPPSASKHPSLPFCVFCKDLQPDCATCANGSICLTCHNNLQVDNTGKCACLPPFYPLEGGCLKCP